MCGSPSRVTCRRGKSGAAAPAAMARPPRDSERGDHPASAAPPASKSRVTAPRRADVLFSQLFRGLCACVKIAQFKAQSQRRWLCGCCTEDGPPLRSRSPWDCPGDLRRFAVQGERRLPFCKASHHPASPCRASSGRRRKPVTPSQLEHVAGTRARGCREGRG